MDQVFLWSGLVIGSYAMWRFSVGKKPAQMQAAAIPTGIVLEPQPPLSDADVRRYNLLRLAAQDRYIVLARVPLMSIVGVRAEGAGRLQMLRRMALRNLDFVLIHPGSRLVEHVVQVEGDQLSDPSEAEKRQDIRRIVMAAGINLVTLEANLFYSVQQLGEMLGIGE
jgi:hypothetical protein